MRLQLRSLKSRLLLAVSIIVISGGVLISFVVSKRYSATLFEAMKVHAENVAHAMALEATERILINDLVSLQRMLDHQIRSNRNIAYLFVVRHGEVIAHTFQAGIPVGLIGANNPLSDRQGHSEKIRSGTGANYLDFAWPIFEGKGGVLRVGFSERPYRQQVTKLWMQMSALILGILILALIGTLFFLRRITRPLADLAQATQKIAAGELDARVQVRGRDEVGTLAASFNQMVARVEEYTRRLEEQTMELDQANNQTRTVCAVVQEIGALRTLGEIGKYLISSCQGVLNRDQMVLLILGFHEDEVYVLSSKGLRTVKEPKSVRAAAAFLKEATQVKFSKKQAFKPPLVPDGFQGDSQAVIPVRFEKRVLGALVVACSGDRRCSDEAIKVVQLILNQAAGVIHRAMLQEEEMDDLRSRLGPTAEFGGMIAKDPKMQIVFKMIEDIAPTDATVLIQGESGTGKELVARAIHGLSGRNNRPFVVINCSAYPETLLESELFGHEKGAFTGAIRQQPGRFELANGGTVFLDEIGEISPSAQIKLLRVLQTQKFERLGGRTTLSVDVRILAATNKDLLEEVKGGRFREDLYYRLNVIPIHMPPLRERPNDVPLLASHFLRRFAKEQNKDTSGFSSEAMRILLNYPWTGNVRELENSIEHAAVLARGRRIEVSDLPRALQDPGLQATGPHGRRGTMAEHEKELLRQILEECGWNKKEAARRLGISRNTLYVKLKKYQMTAPTRH